MKRILFITVLLMAFSAISMAETWTVAGDNQAVFGYANGERWNEKNTSNDMHSVQGGVYQLTKRDVYLSAMSSFEFKVFQNHSKDVSYPTNNVTNAIRYTDTYDITFILNTAILGSEHEINFLLLSKTDGSVTERYPWFIVGDAELMGTDWEPNDWSNQMQTTNGINYSLTKYDVKLRKGVTYSYMATKNKSLDWERYGASGQINGSPKTFTVPADGTYIVTFEFDYGTKAVTETLTLTDGSSESKSITSTFCSFNLWDTTERFKVGSMKSKEETPWVTYVYDPEAPIYMTSLLSGDDPSTAEDCIVIGDNSSKELKLELQNDFLVSGVVRKVVVTFAGHLENIEAVVSERETEEHQQVSHVATREGGGFTDAELLFDGTTEYANADIRMLLSGRDLIFLKSVTIVQETGDDDILSGRCGENLDFALTPLPYTVWIWDYDANLSVEAPAYKLTITGYGDMYDYTYDGVIILSTAPWMKDFCENIAEIELPEGLTYVGDEAFDGCVNARIMNLPSTLKGVGTYAFCGVMGWYDSDLHLPEGLVSVGPRAFSYSNGIRNLHIPASLVSIGYGAFSGIYNLENFYVDEANPAYTASGNAVIEKATNTLIAGNAHTVIPDNVEAIEGHAFFFVEAQVIAIPGSVKTIGDSAFGYSQITSLTIPSSVTTIGDYAFYGCRELLKVNIGSGVTKIGKNVFYASNNIEDVNVYADPDALTWESSFYDPKMFKADKATKMHVRAADLEKWQTKFDFLNVTFVGDLSDTGVIAIDNSPFINGDEAVYDLSGRRIDSPLTPGIYIVNGRKVLIK